MLRTLYVIAIYLSFFVLGWNAPFVLTLGYVWVDTFNPQGVASIYLPAIPLSLIMALAALGGYVMLDRHKGRLTTLSVLLGIFAVWVTMTTLLWAAVPAAALEKWNYGFKTLCFAAFVPFVLRSRVQIEAMLQVYLFSLAVHFVPVGLKTLISGGGYGRDLGVIGGNSLLSEGSTLAGVSLMIIPVILYLRRRSLLMPQLLVIKIGYGVLVTLALMAAIGTYERTALIGMGVLGGALWLRSRHKVLHAMLGAVAVVVVGSITSTQWNERISTIGHYNTEGSALSRILVWEWTLDYVSDHPWGGGFNSYKIDHVIVPTEITGGEPEVKTGIAFHSIYFEVLGEQGYPGLALFFAIIILSFAQLQKVASLTKNIEEMAWARDLAFTLQASLATMLACGAFIGVAFQPMLYYLFALAACLHSHVRQVERLGNMPAPAPKRAERQAAWAPAL